MTFGDVIAKIDRLKRLGTDATADWTGQALGWGTLLACLRSSLHCSFILALFKVAVPFSLVTLGLALLAIHLAWPIAVRGRRWR